MNKTSLSDIGTADERRSAQRLGVQARKDSGKNQSGFPHSYGNRTRRDYLGEALCDKAGSGLGDPQGVSITGMINVGDMPRLCRLKAGPTLQNHVWIGGCRQRHSGLLCEFG